MRGEEPLNSKKDSNMRFEELESTVNSPLDCVCGGNGIVLESQTPCAEHFLYSTSEEFRIESLRLTYANLQAFVMHHSKKIGHPLPKSEKQLNKVIKEIHNPQTPEEWIRGIQSYILNVLSHYLCFKKPDQKTTTFEVDLLSLFSDDVD